MEITFTHTPPCNELLETFESVYEDTLQLEIADKLKSVGAGASLWMLVDGVFAGEIYSEQVRDFTEEIPDLEGMPEALYLSSFAILPRYQGKGLAKIMFAYFLGFIRGRYKMLVFHGTNDAMNKVADTFGATHGAVHENWFESGRTATFRTLDLR